MKAWLARLFHFHEWRAIGVAPISQNGVQIGSAYLQECAICHKLKQTNLM